jgi:hypothetical protein
VYWIGTKKIKNEERGGDVEKGMGRVMHCIDRDNIL